MHFVKSSMEVMFQGKISVPPPLLLMTMMIDLSVFKVQ